MSRGLGTRIRGVGPFYMAHERGTDPPPKHFGPLSWAWIIEMAPPYRTGRGVRLRLGRSALQIGVCRKHRDSDPLTQVGGKELPAQAQDIGQW